MKENSKLKFYQLLDNEIDLFIFEKWIYSNSDLENQLSPEKYLDLISIDFKNKYADEKVKALIFEIISISDFEIWKIINKLNKFINHPELTKNLLNDFYNLYRGFPNNNPHKYKAKGYKFLQNLGLNCLYWIEEGYLKSSYGDKWSYYYKKYEKEIPFYHSQLVPIATLIVSALKSGKIEIHKEGSYIISNSLKEKLEGDKIFQLIHKD